jgi:type I restriction enzyme, S subunit
MRLKPYRDYKDSGVPWLGEIPAHWETERAKWLFRKMDRSVEPSSEVVTCFRDGTVTLRKNRRTEGFTESLKEIGYQGVCRGDLVVHAMDAFAGAVGVSDSDGKCTPVYAVCEPRLDAKPHYYARIIREMARSGWILALAKGIRERSTDFRYKAFADQAVPVPPTDEQQRMARFLRHMDLLAQRLIRTKQRMIELLNEQKQVILHHAGTRGLDSDVPMKPTGLEWLPEVPEHWEMLPLKRVVSQIIDTEHKTAPAVENGHYMVVRTTNIKEGQLILNDAYYTDEAGFREWTRRGVPCPGDILFTREAPAGEACIVPKGLDLCMGQRVVLIRVNTERIDPSFVLLQIQHGAIRDFIWLSSQGSTLPHFNMSDIAMMPTLIPPTTEQRKIIDLCRNVTSNLDATMARAQHEIELIREYRTRLISDVVTGKLDVRDVNLLEIDEDVGEPVPLDPDSGDLGEMAMVKEVSHADH